MQRKLERFDTVGKRNFGQTSAIGRVAAIRCLRLRMRRMDGGVGATRLARHARLQRCVTRLCIRRAVEQRSGLLARERAERKRIVGRARKVPDPSLADGRVCVGSG